VESLRKYGLYLFIIVVFVFLLAYIEPTTLFKRLRTITLFTIFCFLTIYAFDIIIRSVRWKILLHACGATTNVRHLWSLLHAVWFANILLPSRIGEALRLQIVEEEFHTDTGSTIGTIMVEHLLDFLVHSWAGWY